MIERAKLEDIAKGTERNRKIFRICMNLAAAGGAAYSIGRYTGQCDSVEAVPPAEEGADSGSQVYVIKVVSAGHQGGNKAQITINDVKVKLARNENSNYRGLHVVIINP